MDLQDSHALPFDDLLVAVRPDDLARPVVAGMEDRHRAGQGLEGGVDAEIAQGAARIRRDDHACPDLANLRCAFVDGDLEAATLKRQGSGQTANSGADDDDLSCVCGHACNVWSVHPEEHGVEPGALQRAQQFLQERRIVAQVHRAAVDEARTSQNGAKPMRAPRPRPRWSRR